MLSQRVYAAASVSCVRGTPRPLWLAPLRCPRRVRPRRAIAILTRKRLASRDGAGSTRTVAKRKRHSENSKVSTTPETSEALALTCDPAGQAAALATLREIVAEQVALLLPTEDIAGGVIAPQSKYSPEMHADLCRKVLMGLSQASAAQAAGIAPSTLRDWLAVYPKLSYDLERAAALANAQAAALLRVMMHGTGPTAFHALKLFLETHAAEFRQSTKVEVTHDLRTLARDIRQMYSLPIDVDAEEVEGGEASRRQRLLEPMPLLLDAPSSPAASDAPPSEEEILSWL